MVDAVFSCGDNYDHLINKQIVREGGSVRDLIHIIEEMEEAASCL